MPPSRWGIVLGFGGLIPFVALAVAAWLTEGPQRSQCLYALLAYGATILSFLGATHWGLALRDPVAPSVGLLVWGVGPSLMAWLALLVGTAGGLWMLAAGLWVCYAVDRRVYPRFGLSGWLGMRLALTTVASLACLAGASSIWR